MVINKAWVITAIRLYVGILVTIFLFSCSRAYADSYIDNFVNSITTVNL